MSDARIVPRLREIGALVFYPEVTTELRRVAHPILDRARARAPVRTGALRRGIVLVSGMDGQGAYVDVVSTVRAPDGYPYGALQDRRRPYLRPALRTTGGTPS